MTASLKALKAKEEALIEKRKQMEKAFFQGKIKENDFEDKLVAVQSQILEAKGQIRQAAGLPAGASHAETMSRQMNALAVLVDDLFIVYNDEIGDDSTGHLLDKAAREAIICSLRLGNIASTPAQNKVNNTAIRQNMEDLKHLKAKRFKQVTARKLTFGESFHYKTRAEALAVLADMLECRCRQDGMRAATKSAECVRKNIASFAELMDEKLVFEAGHKDSSSRAQDAF